MESFPSVYGTNRQRALQYILDKFQSDDDSSTIPLFLFGDFNFRTNTKHVIKVIKLIHNFQEVYGFNPISGVNTRIKQQ